jgi:hypothetical protein
MSLSVFGGGYDDAAPTGEFGLATSRRTIAPGGGDEDLSITF